jgi:predicted nucleic acid-binding protein
VIVFLDTSALIYLVEGKEPFASRARGRLAELHRHHLDLVAAVSRLTWLEARVGPMKRHDDTTLAVYDSFFARPDLVWVELTRDVVELATAVRVRHGLRTPDALQAASCLQLGPDHRFLSGDTAFQGVAGLQVCLLD